MSERRKSNQHYAWLAWGLGAAFFLVQYLPRVAPSVMVHPLMAEFQISAAVFGNLSAAYLYAYVPMQIPVGMLVDRFSIRWLLGLAAILAGISAILFAGSAHLFGAKLARFAMGFGGAFGFVGAMKLASMGFPAARLGLLAGLTQALGMVGAMLGEAPTSLMVESLGWRNTMMILGVLLLTLALLFLLILRDKPTHSSHRVTLDHTHKGFWEGLKIVLQNPQSWINGAYLGLLYAPTMAFGELWGVNFLREAYHLSSSQAALIDGLIFMGWAIGGPFVGWISDRMAKRKPLMVISALVGTILLLVVIYTDISPWMLGFCLFLFGLFNTGVGVAYAVSGEINPHAVAGTSVAFGNFASIVIGMAFEPLIGWLMDLAWDGVYVHNVPYYSVTDFRQALSILPITTLVALLCAFFVKETHCRPAEQI